MGEPGVLHLRFTDLQYQICNFDILLSTEPVKIFGVSFGLGNQQSKKILGAKIEKLNLNV